MVNTYTSRSWVEVDLNALTHNIKYLSSLLNGQTLMAVVKADGYGHGLVKIAKHCQKMGINAFAVATIDEAIKLRKNGIKGEILILGYTHPVRALELNRYHLIQSVVDSKHAYEMNRIGKPIDVHIKINSGMHRLGFDAANLKAIKELYSYYNLHIKGFFSHLCVCDSNNENDVAYTKFQINNFNKLIKELKQQYYDVGKVHIQSSYGLINYPEIGYDYARIGTFLYGVKSKEDDYLKIGVDLKPVLSIKSRIAMIQQVAKGNGLGYGLSYQVKQESQIAVVPIGYGDGIPRQLSSSGFVLVKGQRCPIVGRICMDQMLVDVSRVKSLSKNEVVTIVGKDGHNEIRLERVASVANTISNEIMGQIGSRLPKIYQGGTIIETADIT